MDLTGCSVHLGAYWELIGLVQKSSKAVKLQAKLSYHHPTQFHHSLVHRQSRHRLVNISGDGQLLNYYFDANRT